jgi:hypothetical protein
MSAVPPSSSSDRASPAQSARKNYAEDWIFKENIFYAVGVRVMDVSMVIAAWGKGVGLSVPPSPSSDRSSFAKMRVKIAGWVLGHAPIRRTRSRPPLRQISKKDRNIEANL